MPYAYPVPYRAADVPPPPVPVPGGPTLPSDKTGEVVSGTAGTTAVGAAVGAVIGLAVAGARGAAWGAGIGSTLAQGFMQFLVRVADGAGQNGPQVAFLTGAAGLGAAALAGGIWGAAAFAWTAVLAPAAIVGFFALKR
jgi:hypothetical protein